MRSCATALVGARPTTRRPACSCASRIAARRKALAGAGAALDELQPAGADRVLEGRLLIRPQRPRVSAAMRPPAGRHRAMLPLPGQAGRVGQRRRVPARAPSAWCSAPPLRRSRGHTAAPVPACSSTAAFVAARSAVVGDVLGQVPVEIALGEGGVVARQRRQHLVGIARRRLVRLPDGLGALEDFRAGPAHPHRADMLGRMRRGRVHLEIQPMLAEVAVLVVAPQHAPGLGVAHHGAAAGAPHLRVQVARLLRAEFFSVDPPRGDQQMRVPVRPL